MDTLPPSDGSQDVTVPEPQPPTPPPSAQPATPQDGCTTAPDSATTTHDGLRREEPAVGPRHEEPTVRTGRQEPTVGLSHRATADRRRRAAVAEALPATVRAKAEAAGAHDWLRRLPEIVAEIEEEWAVAIGKVYADATEALVADATTADGSPAVLKLLVPRPSDATANEITVLRLAGGDGCARLLRHDAARDALLLEKLGPSLFELGLPVTRRHEILCDVASRVWRRAPNAGLPTAATKGARLGAFITDLWERLDRPCAERTVAHALACAERRVAAHDDARAVLVHGDVHQWNTLRAADGFRLVDPDGLLAEAEYDLGVLMREDPVELMATGPRDRSRWLAARTGLNETAIWEWGVVDRVATGLVLTQVGLQPVAAQMLAAADTIAAMPT
ncbi:aminoglycoside phosphotransferase family protein [Dactylosporangium sp. NBC_01737]|uniref:aminoglycoside phosphotransferase family protein n=1 Tax=Dactylosporangium sp. NBC_01737 TaxID=2975959 RepID=UPI002E16643A|nr:aminoglycoside phosphotransferase family protein [Dactylosporangium sp. NBC_01737]